MALVFRLWQSKGEGWEGTLGGSSSAEDARQVQCPHVFVRSVSCVLLCRERRAFCLGDLICSFDAVESIIAHKTCSTFFFFLTIRTFFFLFKCALSCFWWYTCYCLTSLESSSLLPRHCLYEVEVGWGRARGVPPLAAARDRQASDVAEGLQVICRDAPADGYQGQTSERAVGSLVS